MEYEQYISDYSLVTDNKGLERKLKFAIMRIPEKDRYMLGSIFRNQPEKLLAVTEHKNYQLFDTKNTACKAFVDMTMPGAVMLVYKSILWGALAERLTSSKLLYQVEDSWVLITLNLESLKRHGSDSIKRRKHGKNSSESGSQA